MQKDQQLVVLAVVALVTVAVGGAVAQDTRRLTRASASDLAAVSAALDESGCQVFERQTFRATGGSMPVQVIAPAACSDGFDVFVVEGTVATQRLRTENVGEAAAVALRDVNGDHQADLVVVVTVTQDIGPMAGDTYPAPSFWLARGAQFVADPSVELTSGFDDAGRPLRVSVSIVVRQLQAFYGVR